MMGSEKNQVNDVENTVFVAVGKHVKESESTLLWASKSFPAKKLCILHVHQPANSLTLLDGKFKFNKLKQQAVKAFHELEVQKIHKLLNQYILILARTGVHASKVWIELDNIEEGIVKTIAEHRIRWLVMGAAADKFYTMEMAAPKSKKAIFVCQQAPLSCQIWFACMGCLIYTREGRKEDPVAEISAELHPPNSNVLAEQPEHEKLDNGNHDHGSLPIITLRECDSILRANSVDSSFFEENYMQLPSSKSVRTLRGCMNTAKDGHELDGITPMLTSHCSFKSRLCLGKMAGKAQLRTVREICDRLGQAISDAEHVKEMAFEESVNRLKAEEDAMEANLKVEAAENSCTEEANRRKKSEEAMIRQRRELERMKDEQEQYLEELQAVQDRCSLLKTHIKESECTVTELEEKIISAVELLISFRDKRDRVQIERENATLKLKRLRRLREQRDAALRGPKFSVFSFQEINEATGGFNPSKRVGEGRSGSVYQGLLRHTRVAIKMLPNDDSLSQLDFEHEVEILSRVRHPNLVTLIGICSEPRSLIYEYIERGSLEDHIAHRGNKPPLSWQTRVRIATEICSLLIFLHTNNPCIVHGNLKPTNILLDFNFVGKVGGLGISRLITWDEVPIDCDSVYNHANAHSSSVYIDPEFLQTGELTPDSDVYSFGVILLHLLTGRPAIGIVNVVQCALDKDTINDVLDFSAGDWPLHQAKNLAYLALRCCDSDQFIRPNLASELWIVLELMRKLSDAPASCSTSEEQLRAPPHFLCPIYQEVMKDPYTAADGFTYEREAIQGWFNSGHRTSPMTNLKLPNCDLLPNHALYYAIQDWLRRPQPRAFSVS
ncbi:hypothetical protein Ancab_009212 [Ancistrocladus abbreviatus]